MKGNPYHEIRIVIESLTNSQEFINVISNDNGMTISYCNKFEITHLDTDKLFELIKTNKNLIIR